ncbi:MAG TPA: ferritin-like protein [Candidatus Limnocylindria bacterium]|nr:ferritin-like protein [Candidatus Limnocylindria bacterium]
MAAKQPTQQPTQQPTDQPITPGGRLAHVLTVRGEAAEHPEGRMVIAHREALIYTLGKAAELEHLVMCQYLYAAFSLKESEAEGLAEEHVATVKRWRRDLLELAEQEMLHLALVQNLLAAVGAAPRLARPNLPLPPRAYPAGVQIALMPFGEEALRHFAFLERPEGMQMDDVEGFAALAKAAELPDPEEDEIGPRMQDFDTIGHLYRSIEDALAELAGRMGEPGLFIGPERAQATPADFRWDELVPVRDMASASAAIETIVEQGEGARGDWHDAHFGRLIRMLDDYLELRQADPTFEPARPVLLAHVRPPASGAEVVLITEPFTARVTDLLNAVYEVILQLLARYFTNTDESPAQLSTLADVAVGLMYGAVKPLGGLITRLPVGVERPGVTTGPALELFYDVDYLLPHREAAWTIMEERLREIAELATRCRDQCVPKYMPIVGRVTQALEAQANRLAAAH